MYAIHEVALFFLPIADSFLLSTLMLHLLYQCLLGCSSARVTKQWQLTKWRSAAQPEPLQCVSICPPFIHSFICWHLESAHCKKVDLLGLERAYIFFFGLTGTLQKMCALPVIRCNNEDMRAPLKGNLFWTQFVICKLMWKLIPSFVMEVFEMGRGSVSEGTNTKDGPHDESRPMYQLGAHIRRTVR